MFSVCPERLLLLALMFGCAALETPLNGSASALGSDSTQSYDREGPMTTLPEQQDDYDINQGMASPLVPRGAGGATFRSPGYYPREHVTIVNKRPSRPSIRKKRPKNPLPVAGDRKKHATRVGSSPKNTRPSKTRKQPRTKIVTFLGRSFPSRGLSGYEADHRDRTFEDRKGNSSFDSSAYERPTLISSPNVSATAVPGSDGNLIPYHGGFWPPGPTKKKEPEKSKGLTYTDRFGNAVGRTRVSFRSGGIKGIPLPPDYVPPRNIEIIRESNAHHSYKLPNIPRGPEETSFHADVEVGGLEDCIVCDTKASNLTEGYIFINITQHETHLRWRNLSEEARRFLTGSLSTAIIPSIYTVVCLFSLPINICALLVFIKKIKPKNPAVICMMNLAGADLLFSMVLPFKISYHFNGNNWTFGPAMCRIVTAVFYWNMYCSVLLIALISVDRLLAVVYPIQSMSWRSRAKAVIACAAMWILSFVSSMHLLFNEQTFDSTELNITTCHDIQPSQPFSWYKTYYIILCLLLFFLPLIITMVCYTRVILTLSKVQPGAPDRSKKKRRAVLMTATVLVMFVLCFLPTNIVYIVHQLIYSEEYQEKEMNPDRLYVIYLVCLCFGSLNCILDPLVYYFGSSQFQRALSSMMRCQKWWPAINWSKQSKQLFQLNQRKIKLQRKFLKEHNCNSSQGNLCSQCEKQSVC